MSRKSLSINFTDDGGMVVLTDDGAHYSPCAMTDHVLDLIDHTLESHGDAMRWSPDGEPKSAAAYLDVSRALDITPTEWQARVLAMTFESALNGNVYFVDGYVLTGVSSGTTWTLPVFRPERSRHHPKRLRLRRLHSSYPAKWKKR